MKGGKYTKTITKIWVEGMIRIRDIQGNFLPKFIELCMVRRHAGAHPDELQHGGRNPTETSVHDQVLLQKREFTPRETHKQ